MSTFITRHQFTESVMEGREDSENEAYQSWAIIGKDLCSMRQHNILCDVRLLPADFVTRNVIIHAHAVVLAASSRYFHQLFTNGTSFQQGQLVHFSDIDTDTLQVIVDCIYGTKSQAYIELDALRHGANVLDAECVNQYVSMLESANGNVEDQFNDGGLPSSSINKTSTTHISRKMKELRHGRLQNKYRKKREMKKKKYVKKSEGSIICANSKEIACLKCNEHFEDIEQLIKHLWEKHKVRIPHIPTSCEWCATMFFDNDALADHKKICSCSKRKKLPNTMQCDTCVGICDQECVNQGAKIKYVHHIHRTEIPTKIVSPNKIDKFIKGQRHVICTDCTKYFNCNFSYIMHFYKEHSERPFYCCCVCAAKYASHERCVRHVRTSHNIHATYPELRALKAIITRLNIKQLPIFSIALKNDVSIPKDLSYMWLATQFPCPTCQETFESFSTLVDHIKTHLDHQRKMQQTIESLEYECHMCGMLFATNSDRKKHIYSVHIERYVCKHCNRRFHGPSNLYLHLRIHGEKKFMCNVCNRYFVQTRHLKEHMKRHSDVYEHSCGVCGAQFKWRQSLNTHYNFLHNKEFIRKYICEVCGHAFPTNQRLTVHMITHTGTKPYSCTQCEKRFKNFKQYNRHRNTQHLVLDVQPEKNSSIHVWNETQCSSEKNAINQPKLNDNGDFQLLVAEEIVIATTELAKTMDNYDLASVENLG